MTLERSASDVRRDDDRPAAMIAARGVALPGALALVTLALLAPALVPPAAARPAYDGPWHDPPGSFQVRRTDMTITVDGALDEPAWAEALVLELDYEVQPGENIPPPVRTELRVSYDDEHVYFGFRAFDPEPDRIRARYSDRDEAWSDDWVGVAIDTFNDQRRAYELLSNPLGVQMDAINDDVLQNDDDSWNAVWRSAGRITDVGYEVEMAVPFSQLRFEENGGGPQTWGFDAFRSYPRADRHHIGLFPRDRGNNSYLSQTVKLVGMEEADAGGNLEIMPTLTASRRGTRSPRWSSRGRRPPPATPSPPRRSTRSAAIASISGATRPPASPAPTAAARTAISTRWRASIPSSASPRRTASPPASAARAPATRRT